MRIKRHAFDLLHLSVCLTFSCRAYHSLPYLHHIWMRTYLAMFRTSRSWLTSNLWFSLCCWIHPWIWSNRLYLSAFSFLITTCDKSCASIIARLKSPRSVALVMVAIRRLVVLLSLKVLVGFIFTFEVWVLKILLYKFMRLCSICIYGHYQIYPNIV